MNALFFHQKWAKYVIFCDIVQYFWIELHLISGKIGKLSPPISSKKLPQTQRSCPVLNGKW